MNSTGDLRDVLVYEAEPLEGERAQLWREVWIDGVRVEHVPLGSPAPIETVRAFEARVPLG